MPIDSNTCLPVPAPAAALAQKLPTRAAKRAAGFFPQRVSHDPSIAKCLGRTPGSTIKHGRRIGTAIRTAAGYFGGYAVIQHPGNWPSNHSYTDKPIPFHHSDRKLVAPWRQVMPMMSFDELTCLPERDRDDVHYSLSKQ